jgi:hypothetical protein
LQKENGSTDNSQSSSETNVLPDTSHTNNGSTTQFPDTSQSQINTVSTTQFPSTSRSQTNTVSSTQLVDDVVSQPPSLAGSDVPSFHEIVPNASNEMRITESQDLLVQLAEANFDEKMFALRQEIKTLVHSITFHLLYDACFL